MIVGNLYLQLGVSMACGAFLRTAMTRESQRKMKNLGRVGAIDVPPGSSVHG